MEKDTKSKGGPKGGIGKPVEKLKSDDKQARLAKALRANLRRRKEQTRERKSDQAD